MHKLLTQNCCTITDVTRAGEILSSLTRGDEMQCA